MKVLAFHPVQPWLGYADVNQGLTVWDWSNQQVQESENQLCCPTASQLLQIEWTSYNPVQQRHLMLFVHHQGSLLPQFKFRAYRWCGRLS